MGEAKDAGKKEGEKKVDAGKKDDGGASSASPIVLKFDMHCEGCVKKVKRFVRRIDGVENVKADIASNKLTVEGKADPAKVRDGVAEKTGKKVELLSPLPKKAETKDAAAGGDKKPDEKKSDDKKGGDKKPDDKKADDKKPKEAPVSTVVFKTRLHCEGCIQKIQRIVKKYKGVQLVTIDGAKDLVTVKGTMDGKVLLPYLKEKLKRPVEVVPAKKDDAGGDKKEKDGGGDKKGKEAAGGGGGDKKEKEGGGGGGGEKKEKAVGGGGDGAPKVEASKMEYYGNYGGPSFWYGEPAHVYGQQAYSMEGPSHAPAHNYVTEHYNMPPYQTHDPHAPQFFSDENPNACSVM